MNERLRSAGAVVLVLVGLLCVVYAAVEIYHLADAGAPALPAAGGADDADADRLAPGSPDEEDPAAGAGLLSGDSARAARPRRSPDEAHAAALKLWTQMLVPLATGAVVAIVLLVLGLHVVRRFRPRPMPHGRPSDTTDLWQEAGRRFKL